MRTGPASRPPSRRTTWHAGSPPSTGSASGPPGCAHREACWGRAGLEAIRDAGLAYCSPAGRGLSRSDGVAAVPFEWRHVDAACVLPPLAAARERMTGSPDPIEPGRFVEYVSGEIDRLVAEGGHLCLVLHPFMVEQWMGHDLLGALLDRIEEAAKFEDVWVAPCGKVAEHVLARPGQFEQATEYDATGWAGG